MSPQRISWNRYTDGPLQPISLALNGLPARLVMRPSRWRNPYPIHPGAPPRGGARPFPDLSH